MRCSLILMLFISCICISCICILTFYSWNVSMPTVCVLSIASSLFNVTHTVHKPNDIWTMHQNFGIIHAKCNCTLISLLSWMSIIMQGSTLVKIWTRHSVNLVVNLRLPKSISGCRKKNFFMLYFLRMAFLFSFFYRTIPKYFEMWCFILWFTFFTY
jgi:hypothetical protein